MLMNSLSRAILWTLTLLICWQGLMTHYPTDSEVACMREKTEKSHPQSLRPKEDGPQSTAATHGEMYISNVLIWGLYWAQSLK